MKRTVVYTLVVMMAMIAIMSPSLKQIQAKSVTPSEKIISKMSVENINAIKEYSQTHQLDKQAFKHISLKEDNRFSALYQEAVKEFKATGSTDGGAVRKFRTSVLVAYHVADDCYDCYNDAVTFALDNGQDSGQICYYMAIVCPECFNPNPNCW